MSALNPLVADALVPAADAKVQFTHGFFTRQGGVSQGLYSSLNVGLGSQDDSTKVIENRNRICAHLGGTRLVTGHQTHSHITAYVGADVGGDATHTPQADALVTDQPGIVLGVLSADCVPVLLADKQAGIIATAHAGWRGAHDNIIASVVDEMLARGGQRHTIQAVVGPAISQAAYEVGAEFVARFAESYRDDADLFIAAERPDHAMFDLTSFVMRQLRRAEVAATLVDVCTYQHEQQFFSYRRTTHLGESDYGRQLSAICLR